MHGKLGSLLNSPLFAVLVLLLGLAALSCSSYHFSHRDALANARLAEKINAANVERARKLFSLRQYTDDGIKDIDSILRSYSPLHPGVVLPPPLPPEPDYSVNPLPDMSTTQP